MNETDLVDVMATKDGERLEDGPIDKGSFASLLMYADEIVIRAINDDLREQYYDRMETEYSEEYDEKVTFALESDGNETSQADESGDGGFEDGDEAIEYAHERITDQPVDDLFETEIRDELDVIETALEWEKARHDDEIGGRKLELEAALKYDHFDTIANSREGNYYRHENGATVRIDGALIEDGNCIRNYHFIILAADGTVTGAGEAATTLPDDPEAEHWLTVEELDRMLDSDELVRCELVGHDEDIAGLITQGLSPAEAVDYCMVEQRGYRQTEWARERETSKQAVSKNVSQAKGELSR
jgi:hypothetical protein